MPRVELIYSFTLVFTVFQERQNVQDLQRQLEMETSKLRREHDRDIKLLTDELKNAKYQLEQQLQRHVCLVVHSATCALVFLYSSMP